MINLIRAVFPHWNFFDRISHSFELEFKTAISHQWQRISFDQKREIFSLFINPNCNMVLAQMNIIEHFVSDLQDSKDNKTSYKLLTSLVRVKVNELGIKDQKIQFKIVSVMENKMDDLFVSEIHL